MSFTKALGRQCPWYRDFEPYLHLDNLLLLVDCRDQGVQDILATAFLRF